MIDPALVVSDAVEEVFLVGPTHGVDPLGNDKGRFGPVDISTDGVLLIAVKRDAEEVVTFLARDFPCESKESRPGDCRRKSREPIVADVRGSDRVGSIDGGRGIQEPFTGARGLKNKSSGIQSLGQGTAPRSLNVDQERGTVPAIGITCGESHRGGTDGRGTSGNETAAGVEREAGR